MDTNGGESKTQGTEEGSSTLQEHIPCKGHLLSTEPQREGSWEEEEDKISWVGKPDWVYLFQTEQMNSVWIWPRTC